MENVRQLIREQIFFKMLASCYMQTPFINFDDMNNFVDRYKLRKFVNQR